MTNKPIVPDTVKHLDPDVVIDVLSRHAINVSDAAAELGVASADLRRLLYARPQLTDAAVEMEERRLDLAEKNILEGLTSDDPRTRLAAGMFVLRNSVKARRRGWITSSSSTVDLNVTTNNLSQTITYRWRGENDPDPNAEETERLRQERWGDKPLIEHEAKPADGALTEK
jgi:hypothetical protein